MNAGIVNQMEQVEVRMAAPAGGWMAEGGRMVAAEECGGVAVAECGRAAVAERGRVAVAGRMTSGRMVMTRGQRNCNPLNIRLSAGTRWLGQRVRQYDREFVEFQSDLFGLRAAFRILRSYIRLHHLDTLRLFIYRWAPPEDGNNTDSYVEMVSERSGVAPGRHLTFEDREELIAIVGAMAVVESRMVVDRELLEKAYELAKY